MTHSVVDSMLPRMNTMNEKCKNTMLKMEKWVSVEGKLKAKWQKTKTFYFVYYMQVELRHDK